MTPDELANHDDLTNPDGTAQNVPVLTDVLDDDSAARAERLAIAQAKVDADKADKQAAKQAAKVAERKAKREANRQHREPRTATARRMSRSERANFDKITQRTQGKAPAASQLRPVNSTTGRT